MLCMYCMEQTFMLRMDCATVSPTKNIYTFLSEMLSLFQDTRPERTDLFTQT